MNKDDESQTLDDRNDDKGLEPETYASAVDELNPASDDRAVSYGEQGQYAPGGRYNELNVTSADRVDLDDPANSVRSDEKK
jgi:hypothetical protein